MIWSRGTFHHGSGIAGRGLRGMHRIARAAKQAVLLPVCKVGKAQKHACGKHVFFARSLVLARPVVRPLRTKRRQAAAPKRAARGVRFLVRWRRAKPADSALAASSAYHGSNAPALCAHLHLPPVIPIASCFQTFPEQRSTGILPASVIEMRARRPRSFPFVQERRHVGIRCSKKTAGGLVFNPNEPPQPTAA